MGIKTYQRLIIIEIGYLLVIGCSLNNIHEPKEETNQINIQVINNSNDVRIKASKLYNNAETIFLAFTKITDNYYQSNTADVPEGDYTLFLEIENLENADGFSFTFEQPIALTKNMDLLIYFDSELNSYQIAFDNSPNSLKDFIIYPKLDYYNWHICFGVFKLDLSTHSETRIGNNGYYGELSHNNQNYYYRETSSASHIFKMNLITNESEQITDIVETHLFPRVSYDESKMVWSDNFPNRTVYMMDLNTNDVQVVGGCQGYTEFFPYSNRILLNRGIIFDLYDGLIDTLVRIPEANWSIFENVFSPDGHSLALLAQTPKYENCSESEVQERKIYTYDIANNFLVDITPVNSLSDNFIKRIDFFSINGIPKVLLNYKTYLATINVDGSDFEILRKALPNHSIKFGGAVGSIY